ncbi:MAG: nitroreductase family protein [Desulfovibrio sp.]|jgi:hypothetical protein|nr:nitroreductase family protein [Desulfovibrio sp.]
MRFATPLSKLFLATAFCLTVVIGLPHMASAAGEQRVALPEPVMTGGMPLMEALARRMTIRDVDSRAIDLQNLSNMLWSAWGINRPDGRRTVPTARNKQDVMVFVAMDKAVYRYEAKGSTLEKVADADHGVFGNAPVTLIYAAVPGDDVGGLHVGSMYQDVGLYCASVGLGNVVKITGKDALNDKLKLPAGYKVYAVQSIGWPK